MTLNSDQAAPSNVPLVIQRTDGKQEVANVVSGTAYVNARGRVTDAPFCSASDIASWRNATADEVGAPV